MPGDMMPMPGQMPTMGNGTSMPDMSMDMSGFCMQMKGMPAMTMFMEGFTSSLRSRWWRAPTTPVREDKPMCLNLFFTGWTLDTEGKFVGACVGVLLLGILAEAFSALRRLRARRSGSFERAVLYGGQLALGYFLMLAIMSYSVELFASAVVGVVLGHWLFAASARAPFFFAMPADCCAGLEGGGYSALNPCAQLAPADAAATAINIAGMTCATCVVTVRNSLLAVTGVTAAAVDLQLQRAVVYGEVSAQTLFDAVTLAGFQPKVVSDTQ